ncbi:SDR family oxidoreductase [candidate division WOR-3 bacterium]|nr:SDR family oxidoreductase [candidate division WOR-3 bacterium]
MEIKLDGKLAFATASSKGIGFGVAKILATAGANVILLSRDEVNLKDAQKRIKEEVGREPKYIIADLSKRDDLKRVVKEIKEIGDPDIFFFSTGGPKAGFFMEKTMEEWEDAVNLLLYPPVFLSKEFLPKMIEKKWGRIVISTSVAIKEPIPNIALSNVIRISMAGLIRTLAKEVGEYGITVNGIMPGIIKTDRMIQLAKDKAEREGITTEEALDDYAKPIPIDRLGNPEEIGYMVTFLASEYASYINGALIPVDGGRLNSVF